MAITLPTTKTKATFDPRQITYFGHGMSGAGKSLFFSKLFSEILFLDCDDGHKNIESARITVRSWADIEEVYNLLYREHQKGTLKYKQLGIDTITMFYRLAQEAFCAERGIAHESEIKFQGYTMVRGMLLNMITKFRNLGLGMVFIAHSTEFFLNKLSQKTTGQAGKMVPQMDEELFQYLDSIASISMYFQATDMGDHVKRTIHLAPSSMWYAKNRYSHDNEGNRILPDSMDMDPEVFRKAMNDYQQFRKAKAEQQPKE